MPDARFGFRRYLSVRSAIPPSFSPDGSRVAFVCDITGVPQAWSVETDGGWPRQLSFFPDRVSQADFSPVADQLLVARDTGGNERHQLFLVSGDGQTVTPVDEDPAVM
jgi:Tol biopolymer transport system component